MDLYELLFQDDVEITYFKEKKDKIRFVINIYELQIGSNDLQRIKRKLNYIRRYVESSRTNTKINLNINIETYFFRDKTVVLLLEAILFAFLEKINLDLYVNIKVDNKESITYNFFSFSYIFTINRTLINSEKFCHDYANYDGFGYDIYDNHEILAANYRKVIFVDDIKKDLLYQQFLSNDVCTTLKGLLRNPIILNEVCSIVDELVDNIICHTQGIGLVDIGVIKVKSNRDDDDYYQFMINVLNISDNCLYTDIKEAYKNESINFKNRSILEKSYN